jgi:hypothetical protein
MSITSADCVLLLGVTDLFAAPQQIQEFEVDEAFEAEAIKMAEIKMGVDGKMSAGFVFEPVPMSITLQADSVSIGFFETWGTTNLAQRASFPAFGVIRQPSLGRSYALQNGVLVDYSPFAGVKRLLAPRRFSVTWERVTGAPLG